MPSWLDHPPPWKVFPRLLPDQLGATQGAEEAWLNAVWRPFWNALDGDSKTRYFEHWRASAEWREAIRFVCDAPSGFDAADDAADSERHLRARSDAAKARRGG